MIGRDVLLNGWVTLRKDKLIINTKLRKSMKKEPPFPLNIRKTPSTRMMKIGKDQGNSKKKLILICLIIKPKLMLKLIK